MPQQIIFVQGKANKVFSFIQSLAREFPNVTIKELMSSQIKQDLEN